MDGKVLVAALLASLVGASQASAQRVRVRGYRPATEAIRRADAEETSRRGAARNTGPLGRPPVQTARRGDQTASITSADGRRMLGRIRLAGSGAEGVQRTYPTAQVASAGRSDHRFRQVLPGIEQRVRPVGRNGNAALRTSISERAAQRHPALATTLRQYPDAVLVGRTSSGRGYVLHGPATRSPRGQELQLRIRVRQSGVTDISFLKGGQEIRSTRRRVSRQFRQHPAVVSIDRMPRTVFAVSDVHANLGALRQMLRQHGVAAGSATQPRWRAGRAVLVIPGDLINKGESSLGTIRYVRRLQAQAERNGGRVIVTVGNHETFFVSEPYGRRSTRHRPQRINEELLREGLRPENVAAGRDAEGIGQWIRNLPVAAKVGDVLFVHSGDTNGRTMRQIDMESRNAIRRDGYHHESLTGDKTNRRALTNSTGAESETMARTNTRRAGVSQIVYGHNNSALRNERGGVATGFNHRLINLDSNLTGDPSVGAMLRLDTRNGSTTGTELHMNGSTRRLFERPNSTPTD